MDSNNNQNPPTNPSTSPTWPALSDPTSPQTTPPSALPSTAAPDLSSFSPSSQPAPIPTSNPLEPSPTNLTSPTPPPPPSAATNWPASPEPTPVTPAPDLSLPASSTPQVPTLDQNLANLVPTPTFTPQPQAPEVTSPTSTATQSSPTLGTSPFDVSASIPSDHGDALADSLGMPEGSKIGQPASTGSTVLPPIPDLLNIPPPLSNTATVDNAPTDLSQLTGDQTNQPDLTASTLNLSGENLVVPSTPVVSPTPESIQNTNGPRLSKFIIIGAVVILLLVAAGSAYFILGIGKNSPPSTSLPAQQPSTLTNPPQQTPATPSPIAPTQAPIATTSAGFGNLNGTPATSAGSSAIDILRARQQASPSPR